MADQPTHLPPSELGTKEYWETFYARTLSHLTTKTPETDHPANPEPQDPSNEDTDPDSDADDDSDPGTSWFSEYNAPEKVLDFLTDDEFPLAPANTLPSSPSTKWNGKVLDDQPKVLDLGTGNGSQLALLRKKGGYRGEMVGVDYSRQSVELARALQRGRGHSAYRSDSDSEEEDEDEDGAEAQTEGGTQIRFEEYDILNPVPQDTLDWFPRANGGFDIVLDKGTFDAISLSEEMVAEKRVCERYPGVVVGLVREGGFLVVTSCNWTEEEIVRWFVDGTKGELKVWGRVEYPRFRFGGKEGQGVCTVCFQRS
ncbi:hypothetical protein SI65_05574 [Aspergillus cristatus]|uniref:Protein-lysine N-methyltransferase EFM4 n=1 Tax=Aspergillus cristatus TaxID=573508 RepID=A0A1E3BDE7_ASPCR|nr:hypothetical protein SI65_05574 [Aspergillus cristatus]